MAMLKNLSFLALLLAPLAHGQGGWMFYYSQMSIDPGTGYGQLIAGTHSGCNSGTCEYLSAQSQAQVWCCTGLTNAQDNCSFGCAYTEADFSVFALGLTYAGYSNHYGAWVDTEGQFGQAFYQVFDSYPVPAPPNIQLSGINASSPHLVGVSYNVSGPLFHPDSRMGEQFADLEQPFLYLGSGYLPVWYDHVYIRGVQLWNRHPRPAV
jgi:hypothetical protein